MPIDPRISLGVQQLQIADPLVQYGQVQNILAAQDQRRAAGTQNELAQAQLGQVRTSLREAQEAQEYITQVMAEAKKNNAPTSDPMDAAMLMLKDPRKLVQDAGQRLFDANQKLLAYQQDKAFTNRTAPQPIQVTNLPPAAGAQPFPEKNDENYKAWTEDQTTKLDFKDWLKQKTQTQTNALAATAAPAPAAAPAQGNALATPSKANQILEEINNLQTLFPSSAKAKERIEFLYKQYETLSKPYVVGRNLVTGGGENIFTSQQDITPTDIKRLTAERDALPPNHPNRPLYDKAIANLGSAEQLAKDRLNFDRDKFAWEKANPGYTIQQAEDGSIVGVNNRTLKAFPVTLSQTPPPANAPFVGGAAPAPANANKPNAAVTKSPIIQPRGDALKGKSSGLTEGQGNAAMFGSAMAQAQQVFDKVEKEGTTTGAVATNLAQGIVKYVPLGVGDKLVNDIYALAVNDPTKLFGPDVNQQKLGQAQLAFSIAFLRKTSGAMFGPSEVANTIMEYFPAVGEDASVIKQKAESRKRAIAGMKMSAGREGAKFIEQYESPSAGTSGSGKNSFDPLGLFTDK
jgi:hypothetical protein